MVHLSGSKESGQLIPITLIASDDTRIWEGRSVRLTGKVVSVDPVHNRAMLESDGKSVLVDTTLLGPVRIHLQTSLYQIIGDMDVIDENTTLILRARILRCVDGLDLALWKRAIELVHMNERTVENL